MTVVKRKGARSAKDIPPSILEQLNRGEMDTANLTEWLAVDQKVLLAHVLHKFERSLYLQPILDKIAALKKQTVNAMNETIGTNLYVLASNNDDFSFLDKLAMGTCDMVRCWGAYVVAKNHSLSIEEKLEAIRSFAADPHFGVREISWLALREDIAKNLLRSIEVLSNWTADKDPNIRRFASESVRPRGVWSAHIEVLKENPELGLPILEALKADKSRYVQDSVGNWLNDASKTKPDYVKELCERWEVESNAKETKYIVQKAQRTINKV